VSRPAHASAARATIRELFAKLHSPRHIPFSGRQYAYLGGNTTGEGHSLAGYQVLWKALPIARSKEMTVTAQ
jgi:hypothetical protein